MAVGRWLLAVGCRPGRDNRIAFQLPTPSFPRKGIASSAAAFPLFPFALALVPPHLSSRRRRDLFRNHCRGLSCLFIYLISGKESTLGLPRRLPPPRKDSVVRWLLAVGWVAVTAGPSSSQLPTSRGRGLLSSATAFPLFPFDFFLCSSPPVLPTKEGSVTEPLPLFL